MIYLWIAETENGHELALHYQDCGDDPFIIDESTDEAALEARGNELRNILVHAGAAVTYTANR